MGIVSCDSGMGLKHNHEYDDVVESGGIQMYIVNTMVQA